MFLCQYSWCVRILKRRKRKKSVNIMAKGAKLDATGVTTFSNGVSGTKSSDGPAGERFGEIFSGVLASSL